jgi:putative selenate reductase
VSAARVLNTADYVPRATLDPRYAEAANNRAPNKIGRHLVLFDCISCDKCVPVCPNDANFTFTPSRRTYDVTKLLHTEHGWRFSKEGQVTLKEDHQIGTFVDFCNECGNCDVFCPEDGGPYVVKPHFFGSRESWRDGRPLDGFFVERLGSCDRILGRIGGAEYRLERHGDRLTFEGDGFVVHFREADPEGTLQVRGFGDIDLTWMAIMDTLREGALDAARLSYVNTFSERIPT